MDVFITALIMLMLGFFVRANNQNQYVMTKYSSWIKFDMIDDTT